MLCVGSKLVNRMFIYFLKILDHACSTSVSLETILGYVCMNMRVIPVNPPTLGGRLPLFGTISHFEKVSLVRDTNLPLSQISPQISLFAEILHKSCSKWLIKLKSMQCFCNKIVIQKQSTNN